MFEIARYDGASMGTVLTSEGVQPARTGMSQAVEVSVVIPCLNEANSLAYCVDKAMKAFQAAGLSGEVIVADNGSTDGSIQIAEQHGARASPTPAALSSSWGMRTIATTSPRCRDSWKNCAKATIS